MEIDKLPNVKKYWINDGYLNIELQDNHLLRMNFNNMETLKKQLTLTDVVKSYCKHCNNELCDSQKFNNTCFNCGKKPI